MVTNILMFSIDGMMLVINRLFGRRSPISTSFGDVRNRVYTN
ncbi:hypothetical protein [Fischerella thermalis]|nr:hypothetical protein [Fischerella thermalis]